MENKKLKEILKLHEMWLNNENGGQRANLRNAVLCFADLSNADLRFANLSDANLRFADLSNADLRFANLSDANLRFADLSNADLSNADLRYAKLSNANLRNAVLSEANLSGADLSGAYLRGAYLSGAKIPMFCKWYTAIVDNKIQIGCKIKSIEEWEAFLNSEEVIQTPRNTPEFKQIEATIRAYIAYLTTLNK